jgi:predicted aconitase with swiveling domain
MKHTGHTSQGGRITGNGGSAGSSLGAPVASRILGMLQKNGRLRLGLTLQTCGGLLLYGASLLGLPLSTAHLAQFEALNRELGKLCSKPPPQAMNVCRLHARLINGL